MRNASRAWMSATLRELLRALVAIGGALIYALPISAIGVFVAVSAAFLFCADPMEVQFADYVRAIQCLRTAWVPLTMVGAVLVAACRGVGG